MPQNKPRIPQIRSFLLCEETKLSEDGRLDILNVYDDIAVPQLPATISFEIVTTIEKIPTDREFSLSFSLESPSGSAQNSPEIRIPPNIEDRTPTYIMAAELPFEEEGRYVINALFNDILAQSYDFTLTCKPASALAEVAAAVQKE